MPSRRRTQLRVLLACLVLQYGVLSGAPVRKEELDELRRALSAPAIAEVQRKEGDPPDDATRVLEP
ncbi:MAG: hypothetical protein IT184_15180 [Acidobacteria bacterium]|nr:hypothetical protein [Acidobacteriota bacterium]